MTAALACVAAGVGFLAFVQLTRVAAAPLLTRMTRGVQALSLACDALLRLGREGREPGAVERRRLLVAGAVLAFGAGALTLGPLAALALALAAPAGVARALLARRLAYRHAVERDAAAIARSLADALSGGHSLRGALAEGARDLGGAGGSELRRMARELATGEPTVAALESLRERCSAPSIDALVSGCLVHRRSGGDLAGLLRGLASAFEDERRLAEEVRVATAQARLTGLLVVVLPAGCALLAELASPGFVAGLASTPLSAGLVALALVLQAGGAVLIRRIAKVAL